MAKLRAGWMESKGRGPEGPGVAEVLASRWEVLVEVEACGRFWPVVAGWGVVEERDASNCSRRALAFRREIS